MCDLRYFQYQMCQFDYGNATDTEHNALPTCSPKPFLSVKGDSVFVPFSYPLNHHARSVRQMFILI